jgi:ATP-dependent 26S proteasome regulatory subunit
MKRRINMAKVEKSEDKKVVPEKKKEQSGIEKFKKNLEHIIRASFACIWVRTHEEDRTIKIIHQIVRKLEGQEGLVYKYDLNGDITQYLEEEDLEKIQPIKRAIESPNLLFPTFASNTFREKSVLIVLDFQFLMDDPRVLRSMKNSLNVLKSDGKIVVFVSPRLPLPEEIEKDVSVINFPLPDREEMGKYLDFVIGSAQKEAGTSPVSEDVKEKLIDASLGMTSQEAEDAFSLAVVKNIKLNGDSIKTVLDQKQQILKKEGILEYITPQENMDWVGGMEVAKNWLIQRKQVFTQPARDFGLPAPKGILLVGISGCGKSLLAKAAAANWQIGIYRLDVGKVFTKMMGESEGNARKVIEVAEIVAPCILWIDEIEKGMAGVRSSGELDSGVTARVTGTLLTWMQEKVSPVFVVATANDVTKLPPELLRKGRFDEIFFVDLPNLEERREIVKIQLKKVGRSLSDSDMLKVASEVYKIKDKDGMFTSEVVSFTGAEIEQAVISALFACFEENKRDITADDVIKALRATVPLGATMKEEIEFLRGWGTERARCASGKPTPPKDVKSTAGFLGRKLRSEREEGAQPEK